jgi:MFS family permease
LYNLSRALESTPQGRFYNPVILDSLEVARSRQRNMNFKAFSLVLVKQPRIFYGWTIVGVGFLSHLVCAFHLSSTLSVFLKPLTEELGVSRGLFSLLRSGEIVIGALMAPFIGAWVDRYGGRWLIAGGALLAGTGFILLSQVSFFWQFLAVRWFLVTVGGVFMCSIAVTVTISRWFVKKRGRAIAVATLGQGLSKVGIPLLAATLFVWLGWRHTWSVFGLLTLALVVIPAIVFVRRNPEEMGLQPDGIAAVQAPDQRRIEASRHQPRVNREENEITWTRREVIRTKSFWLLCVTFGIANVGIAGLNLHVFAHISDIGYPSMIAVTVMSIIAFTQLASTLFWGFLSERVEIRKATMLMFLIQATGVGTAVATNALTAIYLGFFIYGIGLGGSLVLQEVTWATYYGTRSLGTVRGLGMLITLTFGAGGAPFFGYLFDATGSYTISFIVFAAALLLCAILSLAARAPHQQKWIHA